MLASLGVFIKTHKQTLKERYYTIIYVSFCSCAHNVVYGVPSRYFSETGLEFMRFSRGPSCILPEVFN